MDQPQLCVRLTIVGDDDDPIAGTLECDGDRQPFQGWLGLAAALDAARRHRLAVDSRKTQGCLSNANEPWWPAR